VQRGGLEGAIALIQFISTRRYDDKQDTETAPEGSAVQVRANASLAAPGPASGLTARTVDTLPAHWASTHLSI
jgi:hypothetical protein